MRKFDPSTTNEEKKDIMFRGSISPYTYNDRLEAHLVIHEVNVFCYYRIIHHH